MGHRVAYDISCAVFRVITRRADSVLSSSALTDGGAGMGFRNLNTYESMVKAEEVSFHTRYERAVERFVSH